MMSLIEYKFRSKKKAQNFQKKFKRDYGYRPALITVEDRPGKRFYMIVKPRGLPKVYHKKRRRA